MRTNSRSGRQRLEPEAFYNAAFRILGRSGAEELTVDSLCAHLGVTKGSFYHHFANTTEFTSGLLACWEGTLDQYLELTRAIGDPARQLEALWPASLNRPHQAEAALRSWANSNPLVATVVRRADQKMEDAGTEWMESFLDDPERARLLAWMWPCLMAGMQQRQPLDHQKILKATLEFLRTNLGIEADIDGDRMTVGKMPTPTGRTATPRRPRAAAATRKK